MIRLAVLTGAHAGQSFEFALDSVRVGRSGHNEVPLDDAVVSSEHVVIGLGVDGYYAHDARSTNGTSLHRDGQGAVRIDREASRRATLESGDVLELGSGQGGVRLRVELQETPSQDQVVALRTLGSHPPDLQSLGDDALLLRRAFDAQQSIARAGDVDAVIDAIAQAALALVGAATHVTVVLRDDSGRSERTDSRYVVVRSVARGGADTGPVPITRSVFRRVVGERAVVLAADASSQLGSSESLLGARIRSTLGVPLWKGEEILGVLQLDNRESPHMLTARDAEAMAILAESASLALANARLLQQLRVAEDRLARENAFLKDKERVRHGGQGNSTPQVIGSSQAMRQVLAQLDRVVDTRVSVLVEGETGVGKELIAASVHYRSKRRDKLFVTQNCAALPENLLESELFGHRRGAFTGAVEDKKGLFDLADGGTLFLDEVSEMPLPLQSKLLRALQEGTIRPLGATHEKQVDVRIVAACNRQLEREVAEGRFREDLYYRLKVFPLRVPPLRERRSDIPELIKHFVERFSREFGKPVAGVSQQAMDTLQAYEWPGNVRELQNEVQRFMIEVEPGEFVGAPHISARVRQGSETVERLRPSKGTLREMMDQVEKQLLVESLHAHGNNKTASAKTLGITREGLHKKLKQFGIG